MSHNLKLVHNHILQIYLESHHYYYYHQTFHIEKTRLLVTNSYKRRQRGGSDTTSRGWVQTSSSKEHTEHKTTVHVIYWERNRCYKFKLNKTARKSYLNWRDLQRYLIAIINSVSSTTKPHCSPEKELNWWIENTQLRFNTGIETMFEWLLFAISPWDQQDSNKDISLLVCKNQPCTYTDSGLFTGIA